MVGFSFVVVWVMPESSVKLRSNAERHGVDAVITARKIALNNFILVSTKGSRPKLKVVMIFSATRIDDKVLYETKEVGLI